MATYSIASGGTLTITQPSTVGTNIEFLNNAGDSGVLIFTNGAMGVNTATVNGTLSTSAYFGGTVQNFQPGAYGVGGDQVTLQVIKSLFSALDVAATAATDNASFANIATLASQGGEAILLVDGTVTPAAGAPFTLDANQQQIIEEMAVGLFGTAVTSATLMLSFADVRPDPNSNHPYVDGVFTALAPVNPCFAAGTRILTPRGEIAVEDLREGDLVTTFSGRGPVHKPITWIGQMRESLERHPNPEKAAPVRIRAGAVAENIPHRDLLVSPDHAICLDGVLIPAKELVNDATIVQELDFGEVHYFHIELEQHDILLAEGLTAESYLDTGNRDAFAAYRVTPFVAQDEELRVS